MINQKRPKQDATLILTSIILLTLLFASCTTPPKTAQPTLAATGYPVSNNPVQPTISYPAGNNKAPTSVKAGQSLQAPSTAPAPESGKASVNGLLVDKNTGNIWSNTDIYFTKATGNDKNQVPPILAGPMKDKGDIVTKTNEKGIFEVKNLPPGSYFLVVVPGLAVAVESEKSEKPLLITLTAGQQKALGVITVP
ncbi:MAG TPA: hypothetical protein VIO61_14060 [Anaerolineaceae bacterium]